MGRKPRVDRTPEEKWQIVQEAMKSGNVCSNDPTHQQLRTAAKSNLTSLALGIFEMRLLSQLFGLEIPRQNDEIATFVYVEDPTFDFSISRFYIFAGPTGMAG